VKHTLAPQPTLRPASNLQQDKFLTQSDRFEIGNLFHLLRLLASMGGIVIAGIILFANAAVIRRPKLEILRNGLMRNCLHLVLVQLFGLRWFPSVGSIVIKVANLGVVALLLGHLAEDPVEFLRLGQHLNVVSAVRNVLVVACLE
jgi:hypothetical protein